MRAMPLSRLRWFLDGRKARTGKWWILLTGKRWIVVLIKEDPR